MRDSRCTECVCIGPEETAQVEQQAFYSPMTYQRILSRKAKRWEIGYGTEACIEKARRVGAGIAGAHLFTLVSLENGDIRYVQGSCAISVSFALPMRGRVWHAGLEVTSSLANSTLNSSHLPFPSADFGTSATSYK